MNTKLFSDREGEYDSWIRTSVEFCCFDVVGVVLSGLNAVLGRRWSLLCFFTNFWFVI